MRFDVNCSILFTELPLLERPAAAKAAGFDAVEFWWPFADPVPTDREADAFISALGDAGVTLASLNFAAGDTAAGERGLLSLPGRCAEFRDNIDACVGIAERAGCWALNAVYGNRADCVSEQEQEELAIESLTMAAAAATRIGATVLVEALNSSDTPRFPLVSSASAIALIDRVPAGNVAFLADLYHLARMGEDLAGTVSRCRDRIGHIQIADAPGRGAPGTGGLDFEPVFAQLAAQGYTGQVGLEYVPSDPGDSAASLGWVWRS
jgi:hydroxypyruvate isomerase